MLKEVSPAYTLISSVTLSATTYISSASGVQYKDSVAYQVWWSNLVSGTINVDCSADYNPGLQQTGQYNPGGWTTITNQTIGSGTSQPVFFNLNQIAAPWTRLSIVVSSGTGTFSSTFFAKSLG